MRPTFGIGRLAALAVTAGLTAVVAPAPASAMDYPTGQVTLTVGFGPGGPSDTSARFLQRYFEEVTGEELVIRNLPGGGGARAWSQMNQDEPDGYNLTLVSLPHIVLQPIAASGVGYTFDDINSVLIYTSVPQVLAVPASSDIETVEDYLAAAEAAPGAVTVGGTGVGGSNHSAWYLFNEAAGITTTYIPFVDTATNNAALQGNHVASSWTWLTQFAKGGDGMRMLALAAQERSDLFPDVPTIQELGIDMADEAWWAIGVPDGTPAEVREAVAATFLEVMEHPGIAKDMIAAGYVPYVVEYADVPAVKDQIREKYLPVAQALVE